MAFPILGTPKPQFFDSSGSPLASGTLAILEPADDTNKASYPTYDDAEAATNANANPLTLDARGEPSSGLWGLDGEDYKITLKDSDGNTVWTVDDVRVPIILPYLQTAAESAAGVTPTNVEYPPGDVRRYGAVLDGSTDDRTAVSNCLAVAAVSKETAYFPGGTLYFGGATVDITADDVHLHFDNTVVSVDSSTTATNGVFAITGTDINNFVDNFTVTGHVKLLRASGTGAMPLFDMDWVENFYIESVVLEGPASDEASSSAISLRDCQKGHINQVIGLNYGNNAACIFCIRVRDMGFGYVFGDGGSEVIDLSNSENCTAGVVIGRNLAEEVLDLGNVRRCHFPYTVGIGGQTVINLKMENPATSGLMNGVTPQCTDNTFEYVYGSEFTVRGITFGTSGAGGTSNESFHRNVIRYAVLISTQTGAVGIRPNGGESANNDPGEDNVIQYAWVQTNGYAIQVSGHQLERFRIEAGYFECTGSPVGDGQCLRVENANNLPDLYVGPDCVFKGQKALNTETVALSGSYPLRWYGTIDGSGKGGIVLDYSSITAGYVNVDISCQINDVNREAIDIGYDVSAGTGTVVADIRVRNCRITNYDENNTPKYAIRVTQADAGELQGVYIEHNKIYGDGANHGISWPSNVDYCADRYNDMENVSTARNNTPGASGSLVAGLEY